MSYKKYIYIFILFFIIWLLYIYNIWSYITNDNKISYVKINGSSMFPTLKNKELYKIIEINSIKDLSRDDIVLFDIFWSNIKYVKRLKILPWDKYELSYENDWKVLIISIDWGWILKFKGYEGTKFYKTLLLWSNNTNKWWVKAPQCWVFWDNKTNSVDTLEFWFIWCNKITHKIY